MGYVEWRERHVNKNIDKEICSRSKLWEKNDLWVGIVPIGRFLKNYFSLKIMLWWKWSGGRFLSRNNTCCLMGIVIWDRAEKHTNLYHTLTLIMTYIREYVGKLQGGARSSSIDGETCGSKRFPSLKIYKRECYDNLSISSQYSYTQ